MKKRLLFIFGMISCWISSYAQTPDLIYYKFEDSSQVVNYATDPVGWLPATIGGTSHIDTGGFLGSYALVDTGGPRTNVGVKTGWNTSVNNSFTLSFWFYNPDSIQGSQNYLFGDSLGEMNCVTSIYNGFLTLLLTLPDQTAAVWSGGSAYIPHVFHYVYNDRSTKEAPYGTYSMYMDGVLFREGSLGKPLNISGSGLVIGHSPGGLLSGVKNLYGRFDEFRWYDRALVANEVANTWDIDISPVGNCPSFTSFKMDSISGDAAKVHWNPGTGNTSYFLEYDTAGFTPGTGTLLTGNYPTDIPLVVLTGLSSETVYDIYFGEVCSGGDSVYNKVPYSFKTTEPCQIPTGLDITNVTATSADISWDHLGTSAEFYLMYGPRGFDPWTSGDIDTASSNSHRLNNLSPGILYDIYLVTNCGSAYGLSDTIQGLFQTECNPLVAPYFEDFESNSWIPRDMTPSIRNTRDTMDACWKRIPSWIESGMANGPAGFDWAVRTWTASSLYGPQSGAGGGGNYLHTEGSHVPKLGDEAIVYSPAIDVSALSKPYLSFYYHRHGIYQPDCYVEVNDGNGWVTVITMKGPHQLQRSDPYDSTGIDISSFGDTVQVRFRATYIDNGSYMGLDNFEIKEAPPATCLEPTGIVNTGTGQDTSVTIDVLSTQTSAWGHNFNFEWGPVGFNQGTGCIGQGSLPFTMDSCIGLNTIQEVYVQNNCQDSGLGVSPWTGPYEFCTPFTAPYSNDFDNEVLGDQPQCWREYSRASVAASAQGAEVYLYSGKAFSDKNVLWLYDDIPSPGDTFMALTPRFIDMPEGDKQIRFVAYAPGSRPRTLDNLPRELVIGTMSSYTEGSAFHPIDTISVSRTSWTEYIIPLDPLTTSYNGTDQIIAFRYLTPTDPLIINSSTDYCLIDNFYYEETSSCLPPDITSLEAVFVKDNRADVQWVNRSSGDIMLEWGQPGFIPGTGNASGTATTSDSSFIISGLTTKTNYELYISTDCGGSQTYWIGPLKFRTACSISAPYFEDFDGSSWYAPNRWLNANNCGDQIDSCWSRIKTCEAYGGTVNYTWGVQNQDGGVVAQDHGGGGNFIFPVRGGRDTARIYSPVIDVSTLNNPYLSFYYHRFQSNVPNFWVSINNGDGQGWRRIMLLTGQQQTSSTSPFRKAGIDISAYGDTIQIRFEAAIRVGGSGASNSEMAIDDVRIDEAPPCSVPENLSVDNVVDTNTGNWSSLLKWEDFQQLATEYEIRFGPLGFADGGSFDSGYSDTITTKFYSIDTLTPGSCYEFAVRSICGGDTGSFEGPFTFCTPCEPEVAPYLHPFYSGETVFETESDCWRRVFKLRGFQMYRWEPGSDKISSTSGPDEGVFGSEYAFVNSRAGQDGDTALLYSPIVDIRQLTTPELSFYYHMYGSTIDTLHLDLYDGLQWHNSVLMIGGPQQNHSHDPWKNKVLDLDTFNTTGFIQARFRIRKAGFQGDVSIDEFRIADSLTCQYPFNLRFEDSLATEATLRWSGDVADNYVIEYGPSGYTFGEGTEIIVGGDSVVIPVSDNRIYDGYIRGICGPGDTSDVVGPIQFHSKVFPCDDLETYAIGSLDNQSSLYRLWNPGNPDDGFAVEGDVEISDTYAASGTKSLHLFEGPNQGGGIITHIEDYTSGMYNVSFEIFIADTGGAVYEILTERASSAIFFFDRSTGLCEVYDPADGSVRGTFSFLGSWNKIEQIIDFDNDTTWMIVNNINIDMGWRYTYLYDDYPLFRGLHFLTTPANFNVSGNASDFYIDDFCMETYECPAPTALALDRNTCTEAVVSWLNVEGSSVVIEYDTTGFARGTGTAVSLGASADTLTGLTPGESYDVYVGEICGYDTAYTGPLTITLPTEAVADFTVNEGNPTATDLTVDFDGSVSVGGDNYSWDFGDGNTGTGVTPSHTYTANGNYSVRLIIESDCGVDTLTKTVIISGINIEENVLSQSLNVYPNPTEGHIQLRFETQSSEDAIIRLTDLSGKVVMERRISDINGFYEGEIDLSRLSKGSYTLRIESGDLTAVERVVRN